MGVAAHFFCRLKNNNISSRFKLCIGIGMQQYVEKRRIEAAKSLLVIGDFNIYQIARTVGYTHSETFCRAFKRVEGCTASQYTASQYQAQVAKPSPTWTLQPSLTPG